MLCAPEGRTAPHLGLLQWGLSDPAYHQSLLRSCVFPFHFLNHKDGQKFPKGMSRQGGVFLN